MAKEDEEAPESGEEGAEDSELTAEDVEAMLVDAEVLVRMGSEVIDELVDRGQTEFTGLRDKLDAVWNELLAKLEE